jgi:hypothetical protein
MTGFVDLCHSPSVNVTVKRGGKDPEPKRKLFSGPCADAESVVLHDEDDWKSILHCESYGFVELSLASRRVSYRAKHDVRFSGHLHAPSGAHGRQAL